jgi:hypothetical protein
VLPRIGECERVLFNGLGRDDFLWCLWFALCPSEAPLRQSIAPTIPTPGHHRPWNTILFGACFDRGRGRTRAVARVRELAQVLRQHLRRVIASAR